jgi:hypothetical protein
MDPPERGERQSHDAVHPGIVSRGSTREVSA